MKWNILWAALLPIVFFLGFLGGTLWQTRMLRSMLPHHAVPHHAFRSAPSPLPASPPPESRFHVMPPEEPGNEESLTQAMEDGEFRRIHDFLVRENPMQMNLTTPQRPVVKNNTEQNDD